MNRKISAWRQPMSVVMEIVQLLTVWTTTVLVNRKHILMELRVLVSFSFEHNDFDFRKLLLGSVPSWWFMSEYGRFIQLYLYRVLRRGNLFYGYVAVKPYFKISNNLEFQSPLAFFISQIPRYWRMRSRHSRLFDNARRYVHMHKHRRRVHLRVSHGIRSWC